MQMVLFICILLYMFSAGAYFVYLFIQRNNLQQIGCILLALGFAGQTAAIGWSLAATGHMPVNNLHETLMVVAWALVGLQALLLGFHYRIFLRTLPEVKRSMARFTT